MTTHTSRKARAFTLLELLVVTALALLLMGAVAYIYAASIRMYQESQGLAEVFKTARLINRDLRDCFGYVVAVPGKWINPVARKFPGLPDVASGTLDDYYLDSANIDDWFAKKSTTMQNQGAYDYLFSKPQYPVNATEYGYWRGTAAGADPDAHWPATPTLYPGLRGWWMPGFFGKRDGTLAAADGSGRKILEVNDVVAGSWGWPRADYRMDVNLDVPGKPQYAACWFYAEQRNFNSPCTLTLDNASIVLVSIKFSARNAGKPSEETQLSILRHQIAGFDTAIKGLVRHDQATGNMLRSIKIRPYFVAADGTLSPMDDSALGSNIQGAPAAGGEEIPRCFDIDYTLRNPVSLQLYDFSLRVYCNSNPL